MNKLGGITVSFKHRCFEHDNEYVVLVDNFKEDENGPHEYVVKAHNDSYYSEMINNLIA